MGKNPRVNGHNLSRLTISGGKRTQPRLMMAHRTRWMQVKDLLMWRASPAHNNPPIWQLLALALTIAAIVAIALAGRSS